MIDFLKTTEITIRDLASFWSRLGSIMIDLSLVVAIAGGAIFLLMHIFHLFLSTSWFLQTLLFYLIPLVILACILYFAWFNAAGRQTLGKRLFGIATSVKSGEELSFSRSIIRTLLFILTNWIIPFGFLTMFFTHHKQTLHDLVAKTVVVCRKPEQSKVKNHSSLALLAYLLIAYGIGSLMRTAVQAFRMPTGSMKPTVLVGDYILVDKLGGKMEGIRRGAILVFSSPQNPDMDYLKRCLALPGDTLEMHSGVVYVNNQPEGTATFIGRTFDESEGRFVLNYHIRGERNRSYTIRRYEGAAYDFGPVVIPANHLFMMGDNRDNSQDSRYWGFLPQANVKARAGIIYQSWDLSAHSASIFKRIRWDRLGHVLE